MKQSCPNLALLLRSHDVDVLFVLLGTIGVAKVVTNPDHGPVESPRPSVGEFRREATLGQARLHPRQVLLLVEFVVDVGGRFVDGLRVVQFEPVEPEARTETARVVLLALVCVSGALVGDESRVVRRELGGRLLGHSGGDASE